MAELKAVIYAQYSSGSQREEAIEERIRDCSVYADHHESGGIL